MVGFCTTKTCGCGIAMCMRAAVGVILSLDPIEVIPGEAICRCVITNVVGLGLATEPATTVINSGDSDRGAVKTLGVTANFSI